MIEMALQQNNYIVCINNMACFVLKIVFSTGKILIVNMYLNT